MQGVKRRLLERQAERRSDLLVQSLHRGAPMKLHAVVREPWWINVPERLVSVYALTLQAKGLQLQLNRKSAGLCSHPYRLDSAGSRWLRVIGGKLIFRVFFCEHSSRVSESSSV